MLNQYKIQSKVWLYPGQAAWNFVTLPKKESAQIKEFFGGLKKGFGSLPVKVSIGQTVWKTSIFPDNKADAYLLPLKAEVRKKEKIMEGDIVELNIEVLFNL